MELLSHAWVLPPSCGPDPLSTSTSPVAFSLIPLSFHSQSHPPSFSPIPSHRLSACYLCAHRLGLSLAFLLLLLSYSTCALNQHRVFRSSITVAGRPFSLFGIR